MNLTSAHVRRLTAVLTVMAVLAGCSDTSDVAATGAIPTPSPSASADVEPVAVPDLVGLGLVDARAAIDQAGLSFRITARIHDESPPATVVRTEPSAGELSASGIVGLVLSNGPEPEPALVAPGLDPQLDDYYLQCGEDGGSACDLLWHQADPDSDYATLAATCGGRGAPDDVGTCGWDATSHGDDPLLDELWDRCEDGGWVACDLLYAISAVDSDYEAFATTCGDRGAEAYGSCADLRPGEVADPAPEPEPEPEPAPSPTPTRPSDASYGEYGSIPELDDLWDACDAGDMPSCDELYEIAPDQSSYERFGATCGDRVAPADEGGYGHCAQAGQEDELSGLYAECSDGDMAACDDLYFAAAPGSDYELYGATCSYTDRSENNAGGCAASASGEQVNIWYSSCSAGDMGACVDLYYEAEVGTGEWDHGNSCGGRAPRPAFGSCYQYG